MKGFKGSIFIVGVAVALFLCYGLLKIKRESLKETVEFQTDHEFVKFVTTMIPVDASFCEQYEIGRKYIEQALEILSDSKTLESDFIIDALQSIKKTQRELEEYRNKAISFINSKNPDVRKLAKESLIFYDCAAKIVKHHYKFISSPEEYISSNENIGRFTELTALFKEQYSHLCELVKKTSEIESSKSSASEDDFIEFEYSRDELKAMEKWKKKTMTELITDAMHGDAAGLYMIGMSHLYGKGGFSINIEQANKYFAASALLGFAPAMDKIKSMYVEDDQNPCLALVYVNLIASFGHREFTIAYHDIRKRWVDSGANLIINEVERIATKKQLRIYKTMNEFEKAEDKMKIVASILFVEHGIIGEDEEFGWDYWEGILNKRDKHELQ